MVVARDGINGDSRMKPAIRHEQDPRLVERAISTEQQTTLLHWLPMLMRKASASNLQPADQEERRQEVIVAGLLAFKTYDGSTKIQTHLGEAARYRMMDEARKREAKGFGGLGSKVDVRPFVPKLSGLETDVEAGQRNESPAVERIQSAIRKLPRRYQTVIHLRNLCGWDWDEIGKKLKVTSRVARLRGKEGMKQLKAVLKGRKRQRELWG